ncbi:dTDP-4-dehydrorhamnose reductase family protein [Pseudalkalibacillus berkeleyi]|uniref:dTDP-4-dehydrorhamnose reductase n=1 Tax=Pseudalkalibacillus berkeleyi TaxID=1069813 RepID=A0ABS9GYJ8_9BACL|nr:SDR family oxidoreductase [Pseudalkalibacillus berkeleyi]MCF6136891.1 SDR family oxidoreductase [Pseudalkalibacillus berkeleyi]
MKVLILGGKGMLGHVMVHYFQQFQEYDVQYTHRDKNESNGIFLDVLDFDDVRSLISTYKPDYLINCVGILNEHATENPHEAIKVNTLLPHILRYELSKFGGKLVHISTDCVFEGDKGKYTESDKPDGKSVYAMTKSLGEVIDEPHLTVRTSIIGPELKEGIGLYHWFMKQTGKVNGYVNVLWNGVTTLELSKVVKYLIENNGSGLFHLTAPERVSKYTLLKKIQNVFEKEDVTVIPYEDVICDRTLVNTREDIEYTVCSYDEMLNELKQWIVVPHEKR